MLLAEFIKTNVAALKELYPEAEAKSIILMLLEARIGTKSYTPIVEPSYEIPSDRLAGLEADVARLVKGEPVQYVIGTMDFCGFKFKVDSSVLIPRPETEFLCKQAIKTGRQVQRMRTAYGKSAEPVRILDLCTGSGNIAWTMALSIPGAKVVGVDISDDALNIAKSQDFADLIKEKEGFAPIFVKADVLDAEQAFDYGEFDLILSNPPYIKSSEKEAMRKNVLEYEPQLALFVPDDDPLLFYLAIALWSNRFLAEGGKGLTEINESLGPDTKEVFKSEGFSQSDIMKDFYDKNRYIIYSK